MKAFVKMGFLALAVSFMTSCSCDRPVGDKPTVEIDTLNKMKVESPTPDDSSKASIEEVDTNATGKEK
jgi:hypothetical protein